MKLTQEEFLNRAKLKHQDKYIYDKSVYIGAKIKVIITCPIHGDFEQEPGNHLFGQGCRDCGKIKTKSSRKIPESDFIKRSKDSHGDLYDYSLVNYVNTSTNVNIICSIHGVFSQQPTRHMSGHGCKQCADEASGFRKRKSYVDIINDSKLIHNNKYDYSLVNYNLQKEKVDIICPVHGIFKQSLATHSRGRGCSKCGDESVSSKLNLGTDDFISRSKIIHEDKYDYANVEYINSRCNVDIICKKHGEFQQLAGNHLAGHGCPKCAIHDGFGYSRTEWLSSCVKYDRLICSLYIIKCWNENESFVKIGITSTSIGSRLKNKSKLPYSFEVIKEIKGSPDFIWDKEKELHKLYYNRKYEPLINFRGHTECFSTDILPLL